MVWVTPVGSFFLDSDTLWSGDFSCSMFKEITGRPRRTLAVGASSYGLPSLSPLPSSLLCVFLVFDVLLGSISIEFCI